MEVFPTDLIIKIVVYFEKITPKKRFYKEIQYNLWSILEFTDYILRDQEEIINLIAQTPQDVRNIEDVLPGFWAWLDSTDNRIKNLKKNVIKIPGERIKVNFDEIHKYKKDQKVNHTYNQQPEKLFEFINQMQWLSADQLIYFRYTYFIFNDKINRLINFINYNLVEKLDTYTLEKYHSFLFSLLYEVEDLRLSIREYIRFIYMMWDKQEE